MTYKVLFYEKDGTERISYAPKKPRSEYISKEKLLKNELSLKIIEEDQILYLTNLKNEKLIRIYSKSATHIIQGISKLKAKQIINIKTNEEKKKFRRVIYKLKLKQCPYCSTGFKPKHNSQKYCSKDCSKKARQDYDAERKRQIRKESDIPPIGTINMGPHRKKDFNEEYNFIHKTKLNTFK